MKHPFCGMYHVAYLVRQGDTLHCQKHTCFLAGVGVCFSSDAGADICSLGDVERRTVHPPTLH